MTAYHNILPKEVFHAGKYILIISAIRTLEVRLLAELLHKLALLLVEGCGDNDINNNDDIATTTAVNIGETFTTKAHNLTRLCAWVDCNAHATVNCGHFGIATKYRRSNRDTEVVHEVVALTLEVGVVLLLNHNDKVTIYATMARSITHALKRECHALGNTCGDLYLNDLIAALGTLAVTVGTLILDYATLTLTRWTYALGLHTAEE